MHDDLSKSLDNAIAEIKKKQKEKFDSLRQVKLDAAKCPKCGKTAKTQNDVIALFGLRIMDDVIRCQSWCRICRTLYR